MDTKDLLDTMLKQLSFYMSSCTNLAKALEKMNALQHEQDLAVKRQGIKECLDTLQEYVIDVRIVQRDWNKKFKEYNDEN